jgi:hypothetical protein
MSFSVAISQHLSSEPTRDLKHMPHPASNERQLTIRHNHSPVTRQPAQIHMNQLLASSYRREGVGVAGCAFPPLTGPRNGHLEPRGLEFESRLPQTKILSWGRSSYNTRSKKLCRLGYLFAFVFA